MLMPNKTVMKKRKIVNYNYSGKALRWSYRSLYTIYASGSFDLPKRLTVSALSISEDNSVVSLLPLYRYSKAMLNKTLMVVSVAASYACHRIEWTYEKLNFRAALDRYSSVSKKLKKSSPLKKQYFLFQLLLFLFFSSFEAVIEWDN